MGFAGPGCPYLVSTETSVTGYAEDRSKRPVHRSPGIECRQSFPEAWSHTELASELCVHAEDIVPKGLGKMAPVCCIHGVPVFLHDISISISDLSLDPYFLSGELLGLLAFLISRTESPKPFRVADHKMTGERAGTKM